MEQVVLIQACSRAALERRKFRNAATTFKVQQLYHAKQERRFFREAVAAAMIKARSSSLSVIVFFFSHILALIAEEHATFQSAQVAICDAGVVRRRKARKSMGQEISCQVAIAASAMARR
jgi:hypothetical protein